MTTVDTCDVGRPKARARPRNPVAAVLAAFEAFIARRKEHHLLARLSLLPDHLVRDMGFDPDKVAAELEGSWDEIIASGSAKRSRQRDVRD